MLTPAMRHDSSFYITNSFIDFVNQKEHYKGAAPGSRLASQGPARMTAAPIA
jgi:hypothetical protein